MSWIFAVFILLLESWPTRDLSTEVVRRIMVNMIHCKLVFRIIKKSFYNQSMYTGIDEMFYLVGF
jgi:hypothetical protein